LEGVSATIVDFMLDNVTRKKAYMRHKQSNLASEVMVADKNKTVSINIIQGLRLSLEKDSPVSTAEAEIRIEKLWWYRR